MRAPDKQQVQGLKSIAKLLTIEEFQRSVNDLRRWCLTEQEAELLLSRFRLIKQEII